MMVSVSSIGRYVEITIIGFKTLAGIFLIRESDSL